MSVAPDPGTLRQIAQITGARAYAAGDEQRLGEIYRRLGSRIGTKPETREISAAFAIGGLLLLLGAGAASARRTAALP